MDNDNNDEDDDNDEDNEDVLFNFGQKNGFPKPFDKDVADKKTDAMLLHLRQYKNQLEYFKVKYVLKAGFKERSSNDAQREWTFTAKPGLKVKRDYWSPNAEYEEMLPVGDFFELYEVVE